LRDLNAGDYKRAAEYARTRGIINRRYQVRVRMADGELVLGDEVLTA